MLCNNDSIPNRQRRGFRIFKSLLTIAPGLQDRMMAPESDGEVAVIAEMVWTFVYIALFFLVLPMYRYRKVFLVQGQTIQRA